MKSTTRKRPADQRRGRSGSDVDVLNSLWRLLPDLVASFCHDLAGHLATVQWSSFELARRAQTNDVHTILADAIERSLEATRIMHNFLGPLRPVSESVLNMVPLTKADVRSAILDIARLEIPDKNVKCVVTTGPFPTKRQVPRFLLQALLTPLFQNSARAISASPRSTKAGCIKVTAEMIPGERLLRLSVQDNGPGWGERQIALSNQMRDFHWPARSDGSRRQGLRNVHRLARLLGGQATLHKSAMKGARVDVVIGVSPRAWHIGEQRSLTNAEGQGSAS